MSTQNLLEISGLGVGYDTVGGTMVTALEEIDLAVGAGQIHGLVGGSGSGKSSLINAVLGLMPAQAQAQGSILLDGSVELLSTSPREFRSLRGTAIGYVGQDGLSSLHPLKSVAQHFRALYKAHGVSAGRAADRDRAHEALDRVGITDPRATLRQYPHQLSGGMAQRVVIALATSLRPRLLLADEPTSALDLTVQRRVLDLISGLRDEGTAVLLVTHDLGVVAHYCDVVTVLHQGKLVESGPVRKVFKNPREDYTRRLLAGVSPVAEETRP